MPSTSLANFKLANEDAPLLAMEFAIDMTNGALDSLTTITWETTTRQLLPSHSALREPNGLLADHLPTGGHEECTTGAENGNCSSDTVYDQSSSASNNGDNEIRYENSFPLKRSKIALEIEPGVFVSASCHKHLSMRRPCERSKQLLEIGEQAFLEVQDVDVDSHAMIRDIDISIASGSSSGTRDWDKECDDDVLRRHYNTRYNVVLDSTLPHLAPHIVISPAVESYDDFYIPWANRVDAQWTDLLTIPQYDVSPTRLPPINDAYQTKLYPQEARPVNSMVSFALGPKPVFSPSKFNKYIGATSNERFIMRYVVEALQRYLCKAVAFSACALAPLFRNRYNSAEFLSSIEKSFQWTDPAEPILLSSKYVAGTTIVESQYPCTIPHIVINAPPPQDPWIVYNNATNDPQDGGFGQYLTVPFRLVRYENISERQALVQWPLESDESSDFTNIDLSDNVPDSGNSSPSGTPGPDTPKCQDARGRSTFFFYRDPDDDSDDEDDEMAPDTRFVRGQFGKGLLTSISEDEFTSDFAQTRSTRFIEDYTDDEDEDGPPAFDSWYQTIAMRNQITV
ncbi:hypothetical protein BDQ12DRAFT_718944 [Crucibulum laeve]|uniref:Uncharacterized protein n=1 Tax=Crucibulum laeve TaxID=68775 RepID=A0A5C3MEB8_9AGAR|nr:hypothetical protein BDQ12DRAFT_718944 [Crucibulum laeve]